MVGYYAMHAYREARGRFATTVEELRAAGLLDESVLAACVLAVGAGGGGNDSLSEAHDDEEGARGFVVTATHAASSVVVRVRQDRLVELVSCRE